MSGKANRMKAKRYVSLLLVVVLAANCFCITVGAVTEATGRFTITVQARELKRAQSSFSLDSGEVVTINATFTPFSADVDFGLIDENGVFHNLPGENGSFNESIEISVRGKYTFAVRNNSDKSIETTGYINY